MIRNDTENNKLPDIVLKRLFQKHKTSAFKRPFYLLLVMKLLSAEWRNGAEQILRKCWSTAWGGGTIVNALLFNGEHAVPESGMDMRRQTWNHCYYRSCRANELFACILYHSEFGELLLNVGGTHVPVSLRRPVVSLQRFLYKLCELRKVNNSRRCLCYRAFSTADARHMWLQQRNAHGQPVATPIW